MKNISLFQLGLVLIGIPASISKTSDKKCFSQELKPSYPCCSGNTIVYTDENGDWGVENNEWCGISKDSNDNNNDDDTCFSIELGYPCCTSSKVVFTDERGDWGKEGHQWCGIGHGVSEKESNDACFSVAQGFPCCETCKIAYADESGNWGIENNEWCGIKDNCHNNKALIVTDLDLSFLKLENNKQNMLYSPLSIKYALKMLQEGAVDNTFDEINKLVGDIQLSKYTSIDKILSLANGLFIKDDFYEYIKPEYINTIKENYDAEVIKDEFKNASNINKWIKDETLGIIENLVNDNSVKNQDSVMFIINALAIEMEWAIPFRISDTTGKKFYLNNGKEMVASMMNKEIRGSNASYYIDKDVTAVTLDLLKYNETQFEFMAIMPNKNLSGFVKNVTKDQIKHITQNFIFASDVKDGIIINIPKFEFNYNLKLKDDLNKLGMKDAFDEIKSNFKKMENSTNLDKKLYVNDALHRAEIEFSEKGIKAAAATTHEIVFPGLSLNKKPVVINIDKPFMFTILDKNTKDVWFIGTVYEPQKWEK